jgi:hypothetical protein
MIAGPVTGRLNWPESRAAPPLDMTVQPSPGRCVVPQSPQQQALLAVLAAHADHPVSVGHLVDVLWGADPASAVNLVHPVDLAPVET